MTSEKIKADAPEKSLSDSEILAEFKERVTRFELVHRIEPVIETRAIFHLDPVSGESR